MVEKEPAKRDEAFLTMEVREGTTSCLAICPEFGVWYGAPSRDDAVEGLYALVGSHSSVLINRASTGELVDGKPVDPRKIELARRVLEVPESQMVQVFKQKE